jgi:hypothetical protein
MRPSIAPWRSGCLRTRPQRVESRRQQLCAGAPDLVEYRQAAEAASPNIKADNF